MSRITVVSILRLQSILKFSKTDNPTCKSSPEFDIEYWYID